ncbi:MAG: amino acid synthesis family protein [Pseudomonadota bacterium]
MYETRKTVFQVEIVTADSMGTTCPSMRRVAAMAVFRNPLAGMAVEDLSDLFEIGGALGRVLAEQAVRQLAGPPVSYGKAAIVGSDGDFEHGGAVIHPMLGAPMRAAAGGGAAVIPSNVKLGAPGTAIDLPLGHKDDPWSFDHFDTMTLSLPDAPRADEIVLCLAYADAGRPLPRSGSRPVVADDPED